MSSGISAHDVEARFPPPARLSQICKGMVMTTTPTSAREALERARMLSCGQVSDNFYLIKQRLDQTHRFLTEALANLTPEPTAGRPDPIIEAHIETLREYKSDPAVMAVINFMHRLPTSPEPTLGEGRKS